jgi:hypothetical protein
MCKRKFIQNNFAFPFIILSLLFNSSGKSFFYAESSVKFYVDPATNSDDPEIRMAYGLNIVPPWSNSGSIFVNLPEHLEYMPDTKGIARHHDKRVNVWQISADSTEAHYAVESLTEPGIFFAVKARANEQHATFEMSITNHSKKTLHSLRPMFCFQYNLLKGFPEKNTDNFSHTFIIMNGKPVAVSDIGVKNSDAYARMAQVKSCADRHNWWAEKMGGFIEQPIDAAYTILTSAHDDRKIILRWTPGKNFLSNAAIPCIHADPCMGDLEPGKSKTVYGELIFTRASLEQAIKEFTIK